VILCEWTDGVPVRVAVRSKKGLKPDVRFGGKPWLNETTVK